MIFLITGSIICGLFGEENIVFDITSATEEVMLSLSIRGEPDDFLGKMIACAFPLLLISFRNGIEKTEKVFPFFLMARESSAITFWGLRFLRAVDLPELCLPVKIYALASIIPQLACRKKPPFLSMKKWKQARID